MYIRYGRYVIGLGLSPKKNNALWWWAEHSRRLSLDI